ncbi:MAG: hypothetical protein M1358_03780 [Chloroflexi bacterium]|nr:hypothetical protein [Chloroflexota bacterium]
MIHPQVSHAAHTLGRLVTCGRDGCENARRLPVGGNDGQAEYLRENGTNLGEWRRIAVATV